MIFVVYLLIALTGFKGQPGENRAGLAVAGLIAGATAVAALYGVIYKAPPVYWFDKIWWLALIWILIGIGVVLLAMSQRQSRVARAAHSRLSAGEHPGSDPGCSHGGAGT